MYACRVSGFAFSLACLLALPEVQADAAPLNAQGQVGLTSYVSLAFASSVYQSSWGASPTLSPGNLFWQSGTFFTNTANSGPARQWAGSLSAAGVVPSGGAQRYEDTFEASQPATAFPGEPGWIAADRASGAMSGPEFGAWAAWMNARPNLSIMASDGGSMPSYYRAWKGSWGHVSPLMPLSAADCPAGMATCTFGDWYAWRWGQTASFSGAYGVMLSDFVDSQPSQLSTAQGFNPEIVAAFSKEEAVAVPAGSTSATSAWIVSNVMSKWNDHLSMGYGRFYGALATRLTAATGQPSLVVDQCGLWPSLRRFYGTDERLFKAVVPSANYVCIWDDQTMQQGRSGQDPVWGVGGYAIAAAREPDMRNGANLEAEDANYWQAIASFNPSLSAADRQEKGLKLLKRSWLEAAWSHVATRQGDVRRSMSFMSRDYWDGGKLDPTLQNLITSIRPVAPFGFAVYYSGAAERAVEQAAAAQNPYAQAYYNPDELLTLKNAGVPVNYFVSDAALGHLTAVAKPAAWIVLEHPELIPAAEMRSLLAVAPVLTTARQVLAYAKAPLSFTGGLTGTAFIDQNQRLIVTVSNPASGIVSGFVRIQGVPSGTYVMTNLFTGQTSHVVSTSGMVVQPISVSRWDTQAYAVTRVST